MLFVYINTLLKNPRNTKEVSYFSGSYESKKKKKNVLKFYHYSKYLPKKNTGFTIDKSIQSSIELDGQQELIVEGGLLHLRGYIEFDLQLF